MLFRSGEITINGGTIKNTKADSSTINFAGSGTTLNVNGGEIIGTHYAVNSAGNNNINISGGRIEATETNSIGIRNSAYGNIVVGNKEDTISTTEPVIKGNENAVPITPTKTTESIIENNLFVDNLGNYTEAGSYEEKSVDGLYDAATTGTFV